MSVLNKLYVRDALFVKNVNGAVFTDATWEFLSFIDQNLKIAGTPEFAGLTVKGDGLNLTNGNYTTTLKTAAATAGYTLTFPETVGADEQYLRGDGFGKLSWVSADAVNGQDLTETGTPTFKDLTLTGDLTVQGALTTINTNNLEVKDNLIVLNKTVNDSGGVTASAPGGVSGFAIQMDANTTKDLVYDLGANHWKVGTTTTTVDSDTGVSTVAPTDYTSRLAEAVPAAPTNGTIPAYTSAGLLDYDAGLDTFQVTQLKKLGDYSIIASNWEQVASLNQPLGYDDNVKFIDITATGDFKVELKSSFVGEANFDALVTIGSDLMVNGTTSLAFPAKNSVETADASTAVITKAITKVDLTTARTMTLPKVTDSEGAMYIVYLASNSGTDKLTIQKNADEDGTVKIDGNDDVKLEFAGQHVKLLNIGGTWIVV
jgi:hypothetical protein